MSIKLLKYEEVMDQLGVSKGTVRNLYRAGHLERFKDGRKVRFTERSVNAYIESKLFQIEG